MLVMPLSEIADRFTILRLKVERLPANEDIADLYAFFGAALEDDLSLLSEDLRKQVREKIQELYIQNGRTWDLEADIRKGKMDDPDSIYEVGRRTLLIRDSNKIRVAIKNEICFLVNQRYGLEIKGNHRSA